MHNLVTNLSEVDQVQIRLNEWREEAALAKAQYIVTKNGKWLVEEKAIGDKITKGERWLADQRASIQAKNLASSIKTLRPILTTAPDDLRPFEFSLKIRERKPPRVKAGCFVVN